MINTRLNALLVGFLAAFLPATFLAQAADGPAAAAGKPKTFEVRAIGHVQKTDGGSAIVLDKQYQPGLLGLTEFTHVWVFWWFDKNDNPKQRAILQVHPRGNPENPVAGVFATRSPVRPNLIALSLCKIKSVKDNVIEVEDIDAFAGTPVIDLKPYAPGLDSVTGARGPRRMEQK